MIVTIEFVEENYAEWWSERSGELKTKFFLNVWIRRSVTVNIGVSECKYVECRSQRSRSFLGVEMHAVY